jgi:hypothetical protein
MYCGICWVNGSADEFHTRMNDPNAYYTLNNKLSYGLKEYAKIEPSSNQNAGYVPNNTTLWYSCKNGERVSEAIYKDGIFPIGSRTCTGSLKYSFIVVTVNTDLSANVYTDNSEKDIVMSDEETNSLFSELTIAINSLKSPLVAQNRP